ncbi:FecR domain-containing protein [Methyloterricola oryzae]|uniref:FecR domain-containing protein n=1 Tax=Methyloterricola oryzae TaxID=1495050 RepID=UPI00069A8740|nr:FecR domain-containing protein [Methyloterricola oryzae]
METALCEGASIRVGADSRAAVALINEAVLRLDQNTTMRLVDVAEQPEKRSFLDLVSGAFKSFSRAPRTLTVHTPYVNGMIEGTEFAMRVDGDKTLVSVYEGKVRTENGKGQLSLTRGQSALAQSGKAPQPYVLINPRDAVQWTLYYPPIFASMNGAPASELDAAPAIKVAFRLASKGDTAGALSALNAIPESGRNADFHIFRAALLLEVGQANAALADTQLALQENPKAGLAYSLRAIVRIVRNEPDAALAEAERGVALSPGAASSIALSYAQQALFKIEAARDTLLAATREQPGDALAWARLAELWLMLGDRGKAREAAEKAESLAPNLARTQIVLGFAALAEYHAKSAKKAFERAVSLSSDDPIARLGLGLAKISDGDLEPGRRDLEAAVALNPSDSLLRAYLGKAYFEEKRYPLDSQQYGIAKELDPKDPTAYLYDGILKQTVNRPVEALHDIQASIEKNDNRAVYRGRLLLDQDRAARGTSVARVYNDLGFTQLGINESGKSLALDPSSDSAHRFLSDTYRGVRRRETSRVSELLQAQMMQDVNINPVQPSFGETNLNIITRGGATDAGFNEFTPLFERNTVRLNSTGVFGSQGTTGGEGVVTGLYDRYSISAGAFHYDTNGWRPNNDITHDIYNVFAQAAITPELNVQAEYRHRESQFGDLEFNFSPDSYERNARNELKQDMARVGLRFSPAPHSDFLLSYIHGNRDEGQNNPTGGSLFKALSNEDADQGDAQYIFKHEYFNVITGFSYTHVGQKLGVGIDIPAIFNQADADRSEANDYRGYIYSNIKWPQTVTWTVGMGVVSFDETTRRSTNLSFPPAPASTSDTSFTNTLRKVNPKLGVQWDITEQIRLRGFYFQTVKQPLAANRTLEPTQIAGFNQFYDNANATPSTRYGAGLNWQIVHDLALGAEATWREIQEPSIDTTPRWVSEPAREMLHQFYLYWTPLDELSVRTAFVYDEYEKESDTLSIQTNTTQPLKVETFSVPLSATFFHPSGFFSTAGVTFVSQNVVKIVTPEFPDLPQGHDNFAVVDVGIGYRMPKRYGIVSFSVQNLFDEHFNYQDDSYREFSNEPSTGPYFPTRTMMGRVTLNF